MVVVLLYFVVMLKEHFCAYHLTIYIQLSIVAYIWSFWDLHYLNLHINCYTFLQVVWIVSGFILGSYIPMQPVISGSLVVRFPNISTSWVSLCFCTSFHWTLFIWLIYFCSFCRTFGQFFGWGILSLYVSWSCTRRMSWEYNSHIFKSDPISKQILDPVLLHLANCVLMPWKLL